MRSMFLAAIACLGFVICVSTARSGPASFVSIEDLQTTTEGVTEYGDIYGKTACTSRVASGAASHHCYKK